MKRVATAIVLACGVATAEPPEWRIQPPTGWTASEQPRDAVEALARALPGAIAERATAATYTSTLGQVLAVVGIVVREGDGSPEDQIEAIERANRAMTRRETRYETAIAGGQRVVSQDLAIGTSMMYRRRIYVVGSDDLIHLVDASCEGAVETCRAALATLELHVAPADDRVGWLIARIAGGVVAIALAAWLAVRFRR